MMKRDPVILKGDTAKTIAVVGDIYRLLASGDETDGKYALMEAVVPPGLEQMFLEVGTPVPPGATNAPHPTNADIDKLLAIAPKYGIEILLPKH